MAQRERTHRAGLRNERADQTPSMTNEMRLSFVMSLNKDTSGNPNERTDMHPARPSRAFAAPDTAAGPMASSGRSEARRRIHVSRSRSGERTSAKPTNARQPSSNWRSSATSCRMVRPRVRPVSARTFAWNAFSAFSLP